MSSARWRQGGAFAAILAVACAREGVGTSAPAKETAPLSAPALEPIVGAPDVRPSPVHGILQMELSHTYGREGEGDVFVIRADGCFEHVESAGLNGFTRCSDCTRDDVGSLFAAVAAELAREPPVGEDTSRCGRMCAIRVTTEREVRTLQNRPALDALLAMAHERTRNGRCVDSARQPR